MSLVVALVVGCAHAPTDRIDLPEVGRFSAAAPGDVLPSGWKLWQFGAFKKPTEYQLVDDQGRTVVKAVARSSASGLVYPVRVDLNEHPYLHWHWKVPELIAAADNTRRYAEDSPVRVIVGFDGDKSKLPLADRMAFDQFHLFTRAELPYATLMYIWENRLPPGTVITSAHTSRIKMMVIDSGAARTGQWREHVRDVRADFRRAFGEDPQRVQSVAIMTDSDNTGATTAAYYGDVSFLRTLPVNRGW